MIPAINCGWYFIQPQLILQIEVLIFYVQHPPVTILYPNTVTYPVTNSCIICTPLHNNNTHIFFKKRG
jgi:hypothetical protein